MIYDINLAWPVDPYQLKKIREFQEVMGDTIVYNFTLDGLDLTNCQIRGELYDLNTSIRLVNDLASPISAPEIVVTDAANGKFTATVTAGLTAVMQNYANVEFDITLANGQRFTILQQPIHFTFERIVWGPENQNITNNSNENPLF